MRLLPRWAAALAITGLAAGTLALSVSPAAAFNPRIPQVVFNSASLQGFLNGLGESINVNTDQLDAQVWTSAVSGNSTFTLMIELTGNANQNAIGIYNTSGPPVPPLFQVFPPAATAGWFATAHFQGGNMVVTIFNQNSIIQGQIFYPGVDANGFGFYIQGPGGLWYSEDARNGGAPQILTYAGTGQNFGEWWECFEDSPFAGGDKDFQDAVLLLQSVVPTSAEAQTWGRLKALYR
jgi:hypothetical protein